MKSLKSYLPLIVAAGAYLLLHKRTSHSSAVLDSANQPLITPGRDRVGYPGWTLDK